MRTLRTATDSEGLQARKIIAQGKASLRATPWVNRPLESPSPEATVEIPVPVRAKTQREAWLEAVTNDPLLPGRILPSDYLGQQARWPSARTL